jgi:hypothetical protein
MSFMNWRDNFPKKTRCEKMQNQKFLFLTLLKKINRIE